MHWSYTVKRTAASVGLVPGVDPVPDHAPAALAWERGPVLERCCSIPESAEGKVGFVKYQSAYFEAWGSDGIVNLARCVATARLVAPNSAINLKSEVRDAGMFRRARIAFLSGCTEEGRFVIAGHLVNAARCLLRTRLKGKSPVDDIAPSNRQFVNDLAVEMLFATGARAAANFFDSGA